MVKGALKDNVDLDEMPANKVSYKDLYCLLR